MHGLRSTSVLLFALACAPVACVPAGSPETRLANPGGAQDPMDDGTTTTPPNGDPTAPPAGTPTWSADVQPIFARACSLCHGAHPLYGAPMSLATYADVVAPAWSDRSRPVHAVCVDRIHGLGGKPIMPPPANATLSAAEIDLIARWSAAGAPEGMKSPPGPGADAGALLDSGVVEPPPSGDAGTSMPPAPNPEEPYTTIDAVAARAAIRTGTTDLYGCFRTIVQVSAPMHAVEITPVIDQPAVVHHVLLFRDRARTYPAEKQGLLCAADTVGRGSLELLHGWAPGGQTLVLPPEAGVRIENGDYLIAQIHYNNPNGPMVIDSSGMRFKATAHLRANDAAVTGIGTESFSLPAGQASVSRSGSCTLTQPMHIITYSPHMHLLGRGASFDLVANNQTTNLATVTNFAFEAQVLYPLGRDFAAGDTLRTTCTWDTASRTGTTRFGEQTTDEMCYMFVAHYPPMGMVSCTQ